MITIANIYTGGGLQLAKIVEDALAVAMPKEKTTILTFANPSLIEETLNAGKVTPKVAYCLYNTFLTAVSMGANIILSVCSTMGDIAEAAKPMLASMHVPLVRIDEDMMRYALRTYSRIACIATCDTIMAPNRNLMEKCLEEEGTNSKVTYLTFTDMQGKPGADASRIAIDSLMPRVGEFDVVVLTQASMAPLTAGMSKKLGIPVLSSPTFGAAAVAKLVHSITEGKLK